MLGVHKHSVPIVEFQQSCSLVYYPNRCTTSSSAVKNASQFKRTPKSEERTLASECQDVVLATPTNQDCFIADFCVLPSLNRPTTEQQLFIFWSSPVRTWSLINWKKHATENAATSAQKKEMHICKLFLLISLTLYGASESGIKHSLIPTLLCFEM